MIGSKIIKYSTGLVLGFVFLALCLYAVFIYLLDPMLTRSNYEQSIVDVKAEYGDKVSVVSENIIALGDANNNSGQTVLFHGWSMQNPLVFKGIIDKSLAAGELVIIPFYQQSLLFPKDMLGVTVKSLQSMFTSIEAPSNLKVIGHSAGATLAYNIFATSDIFDAARQISLITPGDGSDKDGNTPMESIVIETEGISADKENATVDIKIITVDGDQIASFHTADKIQSALQGSYRNFERITIAFDSFPDSCVGHFSIMSGGKEKHLYAFTKMIISQSRHCSNIFEPDAFDDYLHSIIL